MYFAPRVSLTAVITIALGTSTCAFPTDESVGAYVTISSSGPVLIRGDEMELTAHVWKRGTLGDSMELKNVELRWSSSDTRLATVAPQGHGTGRVTGVNPGRVDIRAVAPGLEGGNPAVFQLRVANPLEIDSVSPDTARYGDRLTIYGVGVSDLFFAGLGDGFLIPDSFAVSGSTNTLGQRSFWVPYPSRTDHVFAAGSGQLIAAPDSTVVLPYDLFEPNDSTPSLVDLAAPPPFASIPEIRFFNPALAFEDVRFGQTRADWYRFSGADPNQSHTFILTAPALAGTNVTFLSDAFASGSQPNWTIGSGVYRCKGFDFQVEQAPEDSLIVALQRLPASTVDLVSLFGQEGRYMLMVVQGYVTSKPQIGPDRFEENDMCDFADDNFADPKRKIDLSLPFAENLTIDNPHDIDWLRFRVPGPLPQPVTTRAARIGPTVPIDRTDIDLYVLTVPTGSAPNLTEKGRMTSRGSASSLTMLLNPGDYYLVVADSSGVPTDYSLCIAKGSTCTFPAGVAGAARSTGRRMDMPALPVAPSVSGAARRRHPAFGPSR